jgi:hypothetical protein
MGHWWNIATQEKIALKGDSPPEPAGEWTTEEPQHVYDRWTGERWEADPLAREAHNAEIVAFQAMAALEEIDAQSTRPLRAVMISLADNKKPDDADVQILKDKETAAAAERMKIKKT